MWLIQGRKYQSVIAQRFLNGESYWNGITFGSRALAKVYLSYEEAETATCECQNCCYYISIVEGNADEPLPTQKFSIDKLKELAVSERALRYEYN
jgi:hypothetical protein